MVQKPVITACPPSVATATDSPPGVCRARDAVADIGVAGQHPQVIGLLHLEDAILQVAEIEEVRLVGMIQLLPVQTV